MINMYIIWLKIWAKMFGLMLSTTHPFDSTLIKVKGYNTYRLKFKESDMILRTFFTEIYLN